MAYTFLRGDRDQPFLLPPDLRDWLPPGHLAWFVLDVVGQVDLAPFYRAHRDGWARPSRLRPQDPARRAPVCVLRRTAVLPAARTALPRGHRLPGPGRQPAPGSRDDRPVPRPPPAGPGRVPGRLAQAVRRRRPGQSRHRRAGRDQARRQRRREGQAHPGEARSRGRRDPAAGRRGRPARRPTLRRRARGRAARGTGLQGRPARAAAPRQGAAGSCGGRAGAPLPAAGRRAGCRGQGEGQATRAHIKPRARDEAPNPQAIANTTDPDSRIGHTRRGSVQGYNAQASPPWRR